MNLTEAGLYEIQDYDYEGSILLADWINLSEQVYNR